MSSSKQIFCGCGCGNLAPTGKRFLHHHPWNKDTSLRDTTRRLCACGCGGLTGPGKHFIYGHHIRGYKWRQETIAKRVASLKRHYQTNSSWKVGLKRVDGKWVPKGSIALPLCLCGCGQHVSRLGGRYIHGHNGTGEYFTGIPWNRGLTKESDARVKRIADKLRGPAPVSVPCGCGCGRMTSPGHRYINGHNARGVKRPPEVGAKISASNKGWKRPNARWNPWSKGLTKGTDVRIRKMARKTSGTMRANFQDPKFCRHWGRTHRVSPNKLELQVQSELDRLFPGEYRFVGNFKTFLGGKCPDFINVNGQKKLIEVFGNFWHRRPGEEEARRAHFARYGFKTLVLWEDAIRSRPESVNRTLVGFHNGVRPILTV